MVETRLRFGLGLFASFVLAGCASVVNDTTQPMRIETKRADGTAVSGADCSLSNDFGMVTMKSGTSGLVHRSSKDLDITCKAPPHPDAVGRAISRANGGMMGNIILGGGIGAIIDHNKGTAYTYPTWVQLVFGEMLVFDRSAEKEGMPVVGMQPTGATPGAVAGGDQTTGSAPAHSQASASPQPAAYKAVDQQPAQPSGTAEKLRQLNAMLKDGLITQDDYDAKKKDLLKSF